MSAHDWIPSTLGHGESMCRNCKITNREAAVLGELNECSSPAKPVGEGQRLAEHVAQFGGATALEQNLAVENEALAQSNRRLRKIVDLAIELQTKNYGDGTALHLAMIDWARDARAALKDNGHG